MHTSNINNHSKKHILNEKSKILLKNKEVTSKSDNSTIIDNVQSQVEDRIVKTHLTSQSTPFLNKHTVKLTEVKEIEQTEDQLISEHNTKIDHHSKEKVEQKHNNFVVHDAINAESELNLAAETKNEDIQLRDSVNQNSKHYIKGRALKTQSSPKEIYYSDVGDSVRVLDTKLLHFLSTLSTIENEADYFNKINTKTITNTLESKNEHISPLLKAKSNVDLSHAAVSAPEVTQSINTLEQLHEILAEHSAPTITIESPIEFNLSSVPITPRAMDITTDEFTDHTITSPRTRSKSFNGNNSEYHATKETHNEDKKIGYFHSLYLSLKNKLSHHKDDIHSNDSNAKSQPSHKVKHKEEIHSEILPIKTVKNDHVFSQSEPYKQNSLLKSANTNIVSNHENKEQADISSYDLFNSFGKKVAQSISKSEVYKQNQYDQTHHHQKVINHEHATQQGSTLSVIPPRKELNKTFTHATDWELNQFNLQLPKQHIYHNPSAYEYEHGSLYNASQPTRPHYNQYQDNSHSVHSNKGKSLYTILELVKATENDHPSFIPPIIPYTNLAGANHHEHECTHNHGHEEEQRYLDYHNKSDH
ncbi:MAG: hypothetical protein H6909_04800 [Rickettsiaceae bacterium]|nr:hypothetical protein [Rickettsiaceae bacterium]